MTASEELAIIEKRIPGQFDYWFRLCVQFEMQGRMEEKGLTVEDLPFKQIIERNRLLELTASASGVLKNLEQRKEELKNGLP